MAETTHKGGLDALTRKVGPLPVWAYAVIAVGLYYWYTHYGPGAKASAKAAPDSGATAADTLGSNEITTTLYPDDAAWASAAISYLSGIGVARQQATVEIDNYLRGLPNTAQGQADVQLALNSIGPPPVTPPGAAPGPVDQPPGPPPPVPGPPPPHPNPHKRPPFPPPSWHPRKHDDHGKPHPSPDIPAPLPARDKRRKAAA